MTSVSILFFFFHEMSSCPCEVKRKKTGTEPEGQFRTDRQLGGSAGIQEQEEPAVGHFTFLQSSLSQWTPCLM